MANENSILGLEVGDSVLNIEKLIQAFLKYNKTLESSGNVIVKWESVSDKAVKATIKLGEAGLKISGEFNRTTGLIKEGTLAISQNTSAKEHNAKTTEKQAEAEKKLAKEKAETARINKQTNAALMMASNYARQGGIVNTQDPIANQKRSIAEAQGALRDYIRQHQITAAEVKRVWEGLSDPTKVYEQRLRGLQKAFLGVADAQQETAKASKITLKDVSNFANIAKNMVERIAVFDIVGRSMFQFSDYIRQSLPNFIALNKAVSEIETLSQNSSMTTAAWTQNVIKLSNAFGNTGADVAEAAYQALSNQLTEGAETFQFMIEVQKLAKAGVTDAATAQAALSSVLNAYGKSVEDAEAASAQLFKTVDLARLRLGDMANTIGNLIAYAAPLGITFNELAASIDFMTIRGMKYSNVQTSLTNMLMKLMKPTQEMTKWMRELGYATAEDLIAGERWHGVLTKINEKAGDNSAEMAQLFNTLRALRGALMHSSDGLKAMYEAFNETQKFGLEDYRRTVDLVMDSTATKYQKILTKIENMFTMTFGQRIANTILELDENLGGLDNVLNKLMITLGALGTGAGLVTVAKGVTAVSTATAGLAAGASTFASIAARMPGYWGILVGGATAAASALFGLTMWQSKYNQTLEDTIQTLGKESEAKLKSFTIEAQMRKDVFEKQNNTELQKIEQHGADLNKVLFTFQDQRKAILEGHKDTLKTMMDQETNAVKSQITLVTKVTDTLNDKIQSLASSVEGLVSKLNESKLTNYFTKLDMYTKSEEVRWTQRNDANKVGADKYYDTKINYETSKLDEVKKKLENAETEYTDSQIKKLEKEQERLIETIARLSEEKARVQVEADLRAEEYRLQKFEQLRRQKLGTLYQFANASEKRSIELFDINNIQTTVRALEWAEKVNDPKKIKAYSTELTNMLGRSDDAIKSNQEAIKYYDQALTITQEIANKALDDKNYIKFNKTMREMETVMAIRENLIQDTIDIEENAQQVLEKARKDQLTILEQLETKVQDIKTGYDTMNNAIEIGIADVDKFAEAWENAAPVISKTIGLVGSSDLKNLFAAIGTFATDVKASSEAVDKIKTILADIRKSYDTIGQLQNKFVDLEIKNLRSTASGPEAWRTNIDAMQRMLYSQRDTQANRVREAESSNWGIEGPIEQKKLEQFLPVADKLLGLFEQVKYTVDKIEMNRLYIEIQEVMQSNKSLIDNYQTIYETTQNTYSSQRDYSDLMNTILQEWNQLSDTQKEHVQQTVIAAGVNRETFTDLLKYQQKEIDNAEELLEKTENQAVATGKIAANSTLVDQATANLNAVLPTIATKYEGMAQNTEEAATNLNQATTNTQGLSGAAIAANIELQHIEETARNIRDYIREAQQTINMFSGMLFGPVISGAPGMQNIPLDFIGYAGGGSARGTDTVAAMLTPGEFVVRKSAASKWSQALHYINSGMDREAIDAVINNNFNGTVRPMINPRYLASGGEVKGDSVTYGDFNVSLSNDLGEVPSQTAIRIGRALQREIKRGVLRLS